MKINGQSLNPKFTREVELPRPDGSSLMLTIQPISLGFHRRLRDRHIVPPASPTRIARDSSGKPIRDAQGLATLVADEFDQTFLDAVERYHQRVAVLLVVEALAADPNVEFDVKPPVSSDGWNDYADRLYDEFERSGWSAGDLIRMCGEVCRLSNLTDEHLQETHRNFCSCPISAQRRTDPGVEEVRESDGGAVGQTRSLWRPLDRSIAGEGQQVIQDRPLGRCEAKGGQQLREATAAGEHPLLNFLDDRGQVEGFELPPQ
jgi:hypothetical protein